MSNPIPEDFPAGWQAVESGHVEKGDILVHNNGERVWAGSCIGLTVEEFFAPGLFRSIYRRMPCPSPIGEVPECAKGDFRHVGKLPNLTDPLPDTGARSHYSTGAVRDASVGKGHFHSIPPCARRAIAKRFEDGAAKYAKNNWMKGIPLSHYVDSMSRHQIGIETGDTTEDHYGALLWNAATMMWTDEEIKAGRLPKELDDLPYRIR